MKLSIGARPLRGFTLLEIMLIVAILGFALAIAVPNIIKSRDRSQKETCVANLRQVHAALQQWAVANNKSSGAAVAMSDLVTYFEKNQAPSCPAGGAYTVTTVGAPVACSLGLLGHSY
jgi:type II secretory pathway pseudopilin PulG